MEAQKSQERIQCSLNRRLAWNDPKHLFSLPQMTADDLLLRPEQLAVYGDRNSLPSAKRLNPSQ